MSHIFHFVTFVCFTLFYVIPTIYGMAFLHSNIGAVFSPYIHNEVNYENIGEDWSSYKLSDIKIMTKLISTRFPKLVSYGVGSQYTEDDSYAWDNHYYKSYSQVYVSEAVAKLNNASSHEHEENKTKSKGKDEGQDFVPLQVYQGVFVPMNRLAFDLELFVATESIQKANTIFPGTVTGIVFYSEMPTEDDYANATLVLDAIKRVELRGAQYQMKIGTKQNCSGIYAGDSDIIEKRRQIVKHSNFIICEIIPNVEGNVTEAVVAVIEKIMRYRKELKTLNPWLDVMVETGWPADEANKTETEKLQIFWEYLDSWSLKHSVSIWMYEAFDSPWSYWDKTKHWGWWKLKSDNEIDKESGYSEKVADEGGVKYTRKTRGKAMAAGKERLKEIEKIIPPALAYGKLDKLNGDGETAEDKEDRIVIPDQEE